MNFSDKGIPIQAPDEKVQSLRYCIENDHPEDVVGHLWDLMCADPALQSLSSRDAVVSILTRHAPDLAQQARAQYWWTLDEGALNEEFSRFGKPTPVLLS